MERLYRTLDWKVLAERSRIIVEALAELAQNKYHAAIPTTRLYLRSDQTSLQEIKTMYSTLRYSYIRVYRARLHRRSREV